MYSGKEPLLKQEIIRFSFISFKPPNPILKKTFYATAFYISLIPITVKKELSSSFEIDPSQGSCSK